MPTRPSDLPSMWCHAPAETRSLWVFLTLGIKLPPLSSGSSPPAHPQLPTFLLPPCVKVMSPWQCHGWSIIHSGLSENECLERFSSGALLAITPHALPRTPVCHPPVPLEDAHHCQLLLEMPFPLPCSFLSTDSGHLEK